MEARAPQGLLEGVRASQGPVGASGGHSGTLSITKDQLRYELGKEILKTILSIFEKIGGSYLAT